MIELPSDLADVLKIVQSNEHGSAITFPDANEELLAELAAAWEGWNRAAEPAVRAIVASANRAMAHMSGSAAESYEGYLRKYASGDQSHAATTLDAGTAMAQSLRGAQQAVTQTKNEMVRELRYAKEYMDQNPAGKHDDIAQSEGIKTAADTYNTYVGQVGSSVDSMLRQSAGHVERMTSAAQVATLGGGAGGGGGTATRPGAVTSTTFDPGSLRAPGTDTGTGLDAAGALGLPGDAGGLGLLGGPNAPGALGLPGDAGGPGLLGGPDASGAQGGLGGSGTGSTYRPQLATLQPFQAPTPAGRSIDLGAGGGGTGSGAGLPTFRAGTTPGLDLAGFTGSGTDTALPTRAGGGLAPWSPAGLGAGSAGSGLGAGSFGSGLGALPFGGPGGTGAGARGSGTLARTTGTSSAYGRSLAGGAAAGRGPGGGPIGSGAAGRVAGGRGAGGGVGGFGAGTARSGLGVASGTGGGPGTTRSGLGTGASGRGALGAEPAAGRAGSPAGAGGGAHPGGMGGGAGRGGKAAGNRFVRPSRFGAADWEDEDGTPADSGVIGQASRVDDADPRWRRMRRRWIDAARGDEAGGPPAAAEPSDPAAAEHALLTQLAGAVLGTGAAPEATDLQSAQTAPAAAGPAAGTAPAGPDDAYLDRARAVAARRGRPDEEVPSEPAEPREEARGRAATGSAVPRPAPSDASAATAPAAEAGKPAPLREEGGYQVPSTFLRTALARLATTGALESGSTGGAGPAARP